MCRAVRGSDGIERDESIGTCPVVTHRSFRLGDRAYRGWFGEKYLPTPADGEKPTFSILKANLRNLPPATVISAQIDPLLSETRDYADRLKAAGVPVDDKSYDGVTHEFFGNGRRGG